MVVKVKVPQVAVHVTAKKALIVAGIVCGVGLLLGVMVFTFYWNKYGHIVDDRLKHPLFTETAKIYAAPPEIRPGQKLTPHEISQELQQAGYSLDGEGAASPMGTFAASA